MDRTFNKNAQQPYIPKGSTIYKPVIPEKKPSDEIVNNLFLVIADGNYFKIKEHLLSHNVLMTSKNGSGESALHVIIKNSNISSHEKNELVQFAIMKGAQINAYDVNNISPLHLACKYQLPDIIKLLLSHGANVNLLDNQYKTPLHYAVIGENIDCPSLKDEKIKPLIPKSSNVFKINKTELNENSKQLNSALVKLFTNDQHTSKFVKQIESSFDNLQNMFPFMMKELQDQNNQEIIDVLINSPANDTDKRQEIFSKIMDIKTSLIEHVNLQVKASVDQMMIKTNSVNGWGPGNLQQNKILPVTSLEDYMIDIDNYLGNDRHTKILETERLLGILDREINTLQKYNEQSDRIIGHCHTYSYLIGTLLGDDRIRDMDNIKDILCEDVTDLSKMTINVPIINDNLTYDFLTGIYSDVNGAQVGMQKYNLIATTNPSRIRIDKDEIEEYKNNNGGAYPKRARLELPFVIGGNFDNRGAVRINVNPVGDLANDPNSIGLYFNTKIKFYSQLLNNTYSRLKRNMKDISSGLDGDQQNLLPLLYEKNIPNSVTQLLNMTMLLASINDSINSVKLGFSELYRKYDDIIPNFIGNPDYLFIVEQIKQDLNDISKQDLTKMCDDIYNSIQNIVKSLNGIISFIESMSASKCIDSYFKYNSFDNFYQSLTSPSVSNIVTGPLEKIREFPKDLSFVGVSGSNIVERRKNLIEKFMMQVTLLNLPTGIVSVRSGINQRMLPTIGYLGIDNAGNIPSLGIDTLNGNALHQIKLTEIGQDVTKVNNPVATLIGNIAYLHPVNKNKDDFSYPIVGTFYSVFLTMLKYAIIRHVTNMSYNLLTKTYVPVNQHESDLKIIIEKLNDDVKQIVKFDANDYGFILTMVGRAVDKYLINFINGKITVKINEILLNMVRNSIPKHYTELINTIFNKVFSTTVLNPDNGISLDMNETFEELTILYQENLQNGVQNDMINLRDIATITIGNLNEEFAKKKKIHKITNFDAETQTRNEICYKYDQDVINTLLNFNAKVNLKDAIGNTPLYYAIETHNILAIKELKKHGAIIYSTTSTNKFGKCALEHAWELYAMQLQKQIGNKYEICKNATEKIIHKLKKNEKYFNNIPKYSLLILPMTLYLLNHQFYLTGKGYANGWKYSNNEEFEHLLNLNVDSPLPLLNVNLDIEEFEPKSYVESSKQQVSIKTELLSILTTRKKNLMEELTNLNNGTQPVTFVDNLRIDQIQKAIQSIDNKINNFNIEIGSLNNQIIKTDNFSKGSKTTLKQFIEGNKQYFKLYDDDVTDIYNSVFVDVINHDIKPILDQKKYYYSTDVRTYPLMWKKYFEENSTKFNDYTQVIDLIVNYQKSLLNDTNKSSLEKIRDVRLVAQYHSKIINPFCEHYFELEQVYGGTNYAMTKIINIIVHVIKHTLCVNLFGFIVKTLTKFVLNTMPQHQHDNKQYAYSITQLVIEIIDANRGTFNGSSLMNYIFETLPLKLVKVVLQIYEGPDEGEDDLDKRLTAESIFNHINKILESSTTIELKDKSSLLLNLKEYAYPFYIDYSTQFIKEMKNLIDSYMRQLQGDFNMLNILEELSEK